MANERCNEQLNYLLENCIWINAYLAIWHKIDKNSDLEFLRHYYDLSTTITKALIYSAIIALSKIYDPNSSGANIISFLHSINSNKYFIESENLKEIKDFAKKQEGELEEEELKKLRKNLKSWRDKFYAHMDKDFLNDEIALHQAYPINVQEFETLLNFIKYTIERFFVLINGSSPLDHVTLKCEKEMDLLVKRLEIDYQRHQQDLSLISQIINGK